MFFTSLRRHHEIRLFAVINIADQATSILLPKNKRCLAITLIPDGPLNGWYIPEDFRFKISGPPFTFDIFHHNDSSSQIYKDKLYLHGMSLRTLHL